LTHATLARLCAHRAWGRIRDAPQNSCTSEFWGASLILHFHPKVQFITATETWQYTRSPIRFSTSNSNGWTHQTKCISSKSYPLTAAGSHTNFGHRSRKKL